MSVAVHLLRHDDPADVLQVHLVADAGVRGHHLEVVEALLRPLEQGVALAVALVFPGDVLGEGLAGPPGVHLDRVIDDQVHRHEGVDLAGVSAEGLQRIPHGRQIHHGRDPGEVLHQHPGRVVGDFHGRRVTLFPAGDVEHILFGDDPAVEFAQQVFHENPDGEGQPADRGQAFLLQQADVEKPVRLLLNGDVAQEVCLFHGRPLFRSPVNAPRFYRHGGCRPCRRR